MTLTHNTYDRNIQLEASRRRLEDAKSLLEKNRWAGAMYLGGYAIECALVALICFQQKQNNLKKAVAWTLKTPNIQGSGIHRLNNSLQITGIKNKFPLDITGKLQNAWNLVSSEWEYSKLRYYDKNGDEQTAKNFIQAVEVLHVFLLNEQGVI